MFSTRQQLHNFFLLLGSTCILFRAQLKRQVYLLQLVTILKFINTLLKHSSQGNSFRTILNCVETNSGLHWFCITSLCDWSRKLTSLFKAITCKTKSNHDLVARVFPRFLAVCLFLLWGLICSVTPLPRRVTNIYFLLTISPLNHTVRPWE